MYCYLAHFAHVIKVVFGHCVYLLKSPQKIKMRHCFLSWTQSGGQSIFGLFNYHHSQQFVSLWFQNSLAFGNAQYTVHCTGSPCPDFKSVQCLEVLIRHLWPSCIVSISSTIFRNLTSYLWNLLSAVSLVTNRSSFFSHSPARLDDVVQFAFTDSLNPCSRLCLLMVWKRWPAQRMWVSSVLARYLL